MRWAAIILVGCVGCSVPPPTGDPLYSPAIELAREFLGGGHSPEVVGVPWDCSQQTLAGIGYGFRRNGDGLCVSGLELGGVVYIMVHPDMRYSLALCHEMRHVFGGSESHKERATWGPMYGGTVDDEIPRCNAFLAERLDNLDFVVPR